MKTYLYTVTQSLHLEKWQDTSVDRLSWLLFVGCLTCHQHAVVSQGWICSDSCTCCHTEAEAAHQTCCLTQSQYTDTGPASLSNNPTTPGTWQGATGAWIFKSLVRLHLEKRSIQSGNRTQICRSWGRRSDHGASKAVNSHGSTSRAPTFFFFRVRYDGCVD